MSKTDCEIRQRIVLIKAFERLAQREGYRLSLRNDGRYSHENARAAWNGFRMGVEYATGHRPESEVSDE